jgi:DNA-binding NarL/FixJ family response regulator
LSKKRFGFKRFLLQPHMPPFLISKHDDEKRYNHGGRMKKPRVLLADDHQVVLEGLKSLLAGEFEVVGSVGDGRALVDQAAALHPDVIVADISMPALNGIEAARQIKKTDKNIKIVFLTMHPDATYAANAFEAGASGFVLKHSAPSELITAIHEAMKGRTYVTPLIAGDLIRTYQEGGSPEKDLFQKISPRQREILQLLAEGKSAKEIASILDISTRTVEFHKYRMMQQLNIKTSAELVQYAVRHGIISV